MTGRADDGLHIGRAHLVAIGPLPAPQLRPAAISIENNGYMLRKRFFIRHNKDS